MTRVTYPHSLTIWTKGVEGVEGVAQNLKRVLRRQQTRNKYGAAKDDRKAN